MIELALLAVGAIVAGVKAARYEQRLLAGRRAQEQVWQDAVRACGWEPTSARSDLGSTFVVARRGGRTLTITPSGGTGSSAALVRIEGLPGTLRISRDSLRIQVAQLVDTGRIPTGDPEFDAAFFLEGDPLGIRAAFDAEARRVALGLFRLGRGSSEGSGVAGGALSLRYRDDVRPPQLEPAEYLRQALALADRLSGEHVEERLAAIVREDPIAAVRRLALEALCDERASDPTTRAVLADACADSDPLVRLTSALGLGPIDGRATLVALASEAETTDDASARAIAPIGPSLTTDEARAILSASLRNRRASTAAICVDLLDHTGGAEPDVLAHLLERSDGALALSAVRALGRCGTAAHVPALRDAEKGAVGFGPLADACRGAVAAIQARSHGATPGQLSLSAGGGEVSLADDTRGRLELPQGPVGGTDEPGRRG